MGSQQQDSSSRAAHYGDGSPDDSAGAFRRHEGGGGLLNALVQRRSNNRQNPNQPTSRLWPGAAANSSTTKGLFHARKRSQAVDPSVSLQGLKHDREEVAVTARKHKNPFRPFVPSPFLRQRTGLSLVRTNYSIRKASIRQNEKADYARASDSEKQGVDNREDFRKLDAKFHVSSYAHNVANITQSRAFAMLFVYIDLAVDLLLCVLYVYQISTINPLPDAPTPFWLFIERPRWLYLLLLVLNFYNLASYLIRISVTNEKRRALMSYHPIIDLLTTVPFVVSLFISNGQYLYVPYFLRCWYIIWRSNRAMSVHMDVDADLGTVSVNPLRHQLIILLSFLTAILFTMASAFQWSEMMFSETTYSAIDVLYFSLVTAATVGYGDISPNHWISRIIVIVILLVILSIVPGLISDFLDTWNLNRESSKGFTAGTHEHVILIGNFTNPNRVQDLLNGFLDIRNTRTPNRHVVIFGPGEAPLAVQNLLALPFYRACTTYLQGDALDERNYGRMESGTASAAFVLSNRRATDWFEEDQNTTLTAWSFHIHNPTVPLYTEVLLPETAAFHQMTEMVICVDQVKQVVLACNCLYVGVSTFIMNLIFQSNPSNACSLAWEFQYSDGLANEIYHAVANPVLVGKNFAFVSWFLYVEFQVVLFAVRPEDGELLLNPGRAYSIQKGDTCYYIAHHTTDLEHIQEMTEVEMDRAMKQYGVAPLSQDVTLDVIEVPEGEPESADAKPAGDFKIVNASDDEDENEIRAVARKNKNVPAKYHKQPQSSSPPASHENIRKLDKVLTPAVNDLVSELTDGTYIGRPESPHSSVRDDQPPLCRLLKTPLTEQHQCVLDDATHLRDHTLVCAGEQPLFRFMCTLRSAAIPASEMRTILILGADKPSDEEFHSTLAVFPDVKYMVGDCRRKRDMLRAGVEHAHTVLIMSKPENAFKGSPDERQPRNAVEDMSSSKADSAACLATHVVHQVLASEGICINGMKQRGGRGGAGEDGGTRGEAAGDGDGPASTGDLGIVGPVKQLEERDGRISTSDAGSSVLLPADGASMKGSHHRSHSSTSSKTSDNDNHNHHSHHHHHRPRRTVTVVTELLDRKNIRFLHALVSPASIIDHLHSPTYASGHAVVSALIDNFVYAVYQNAATIDIVKGMCGDLRDRRSKAGQNSSCLTTAGWEDWMEGKPFEEVYRVLAIERGVIPVAVIRAPDDALGNELPFVYTNPVPSLLLAKGDRLFVL
ncbi:potassium channel, sub T, member 2 [Geranomyces variabilis]|nr:potassium channel, sub T, member 2 [Geranomyces variabilis]